MIAVVFFFVLATISQANSQHTATPAVVALLHRFAEYSAAAYCPENYLAVPANLSICLEDVCPGVQSSYRIHAFSGSGTPYAILAIDHQLSLMTMSFRGTVDEEDWKKDIDFILENASDICHDCQVHRGFLGSWRKGRSAILGFWKSVRTRYPDYKTVVTGHSLGGALANLCALQMQNLTDGDPVFLFTYGAPRVGDGNFAKSIEIALKGNSYRVTHLNDPVPRLPGRLLGFVHPFPEYHITSPHIPHVLKANETVLTSPANLVVDPHDILVLSRSESDEGDDGYSCSNIAMHDAYFIDISKCHANDTTPVLGGT